MGDGDDRRVALHRELAQQVHDDAGALGIERGGRLVGENDARAVGERAGIVMDLLKKVAAEQAAGIVVVTHDEKIFNRLDRIYMLRDGTLEGSGLDPLAGPDGLSREKAVHG